MPIEQKSKIKKPGISSSRSFFDLPIEIRQIIYKLCLTDAVNSEQGAKPDQPIVRFVGNTTHIVGSPCPCSKPSVTIIPNVDPGQLPHMVLEESRHGPWKPAGLVVGLLRVNKQIHEEAACVLYGNNTFEFQIGIHRHNWHVPNYNNICRREYFDFVDNCLDLPPRYLQMVKKCLLRIRLVTTPYTVARPTYLRALERVTLLTNILSKGHSLQKLSASLVQPRSYLNQPVFQGRHTSCFQNVLEPLGTLHGIRDVKIENVSPVFEVKLTMALKGTEVACWLAEEVYETKMVKFNGRRRPQTRRLRIYHEPRYIWKPYIPVLGDPMMDVDVSQENQLSEIPDAS